MSKVTYEECPLLELIRMVVKGVRVTSVKGRVIRGLFGLFELIRIIGFRVYACDLGYWGNLVIRVSNFVHVIKVAIMTGTKVKCVRIP